VQPAHVLVPEDGLVLESEPKRDRSPIGGRLSQNRNALMGVAANHEFDALQKFEVVQERPNVSWRQQALRFESPDRIPGPGLAQTGSGPSLFELKRLRKEFDVHKAAGTRLEGPFRGRGNVAFLFYSRAHGPDREAIRAGKPLCVKPPFDPGLEFGREAGRPADFSGSKERLSLPYLRAVLMVRAKGWERRHKRPRISVGAKAQIDGERGPEGAARLQNCPNRFEFRGGRHLGPFRDHDQKVEIGTGR
jgi:hypothetical protein